MAPTQLELVRAEQPRRSRSRRRNGEVRSFRTVGLFAGIGGLELGLGRAGHECAMLCEIDKSALAVLDQQFSEVPKHGDITTLKRLPQGTDLVVAGFPCQDLSQAGKTAGITGARSGLVGEVFRLVERDRVPWLVLENVPFMLQLARGKALDVIIAAIERLGYRWAYRVLDSRAFGVPQRRERVFLVASLVDDPRDVILAHDVGEPAPRSSDGVACGFYWTEGIRGLGWAVDAVPTLKGGSTIGIPSSPAILMPDGSIVKPDLRDVERMQGFRAGWTKAAETVVKKGYRWKLVGNAVTVDVAEWIGGMLARPAKYDASHDRPLRPGTPWPRAAWNVGQGRFVSDVSAYPVKRKSEPLTSFLRFPTEPLSAKATAGFLSRARSGSLRFPPGFLDAVEAHLRRMEAAAAA